MKRLFSKKNLILKTFLFLFLFSLLFFPLNFFYNQNKAILAVEEEVEEEEVYKNLKCGREIPVGEAMEKTGEFLGEIAKELEIIETNSYYLIEAQEKMEKLAKECSLENCTPKCEIFTISEAGLTKCIPKPCQGDPCKEREEIEKRFAEITRLNEEIQGARDKIYKLIYQNVEPLCIKENEDIRTWTENLGCGLAFLNLTCRDFVQQTILTWLPEKLANFLDTCPSITVQEAIARKLNLSRGEFDKCYISYKDTEKILQGEITGKYLLSWQQLEKENYPRYTKTEIEVEGKKIPVCTSPLNWFCCTDTP